MYSELIFFFA